MGSRDLRAPRRRSRRRNRPPWLRSALYAGGFLVLASISTIAYSYISFSRLIDERLHGERERTLPRVYARPVVLRRGLAVTQPQLVSLLNDLGYAQRPRAEAPGEFAIERGGVVLRARTSDLGGAAVRVRVTSTIQSLEVTGRGRSESVALEAPLLTALMTSGGRAESPTVPPSTNSPLHPQSGRARATWAAPRCTSGSAAPFRASRSPDADARNRCGWKRRC